MKRWNGWGEESTQTALSSESLALLSGLTGKPHEGQAVLAKEEALKRAGEKVFSGWEGVDSSAEARLSHARGQSFADWLAFRQGHGLQFPEGVVYPKDEGEIQRHLEGARRAGARIVVYGGGTSVVGHINRPAGEKPVVIMDMQRMGRLLSVDRTSQMARFEAGVRGPDIEAQLAPHGMIMGHFPQSYEYATLGGWVATRSSGQQSLYYGRIEDLFAGGRLITAEGEMELPPLPASSAGVDLRQVWMGSEGLMGVISEATVRVRALPDVESFHGVFFPRWEQAEEFAREVVQSRVPVSMLRLSSGKETFVTLALAGKPTQIRWLERYLSWRGVREEKCLVIVGLTGKSVQVKQTRAMVGRLASAQGGVWIGQSLGRAWKKNRFHGPYLRNTLWDHGWGVDTLETAMPYAQVRAGVAKIEAALEEAAAAFGEKILVYTHLSHFYITGCAIYTTYLFRLQRTPEETFAMWKAMKSKASEAILSLRGTISHQHGVGKDHAAYLGAEKSAMGMQWMRSMVEKADPEGLFANGNLFPAGEPILQSAFEQQG